MRAWLVWAVLGCFCADRAASQWFDTTRKARIGYLPKYAPSKLAMYEGYFENRTGWEIDWVSLDDHRKGSTLLTNGDLDMAVMDSADISRLFSRQGRAKLIWIEEELKDSEGLIVHSMYHASSFRHKPGADCVRTPLDLKGRRVGVEFGSTSYYALISYFKEFNVSVVHDWTYQRKHPCAFNQSGLAIPCHFANQTNAVHLYAMMPDEIQQAYYAGTIHAAYIGYPHLSTMRKHGKILLTSKELGYWDKVTFNGLVATTSFLERPDVTKFLMDYLQTMARANFYYYNNTKEFQLYYKGRYSVSAKLAAVIDGVDTQVDFHVSQYYYPKFPEQIGREWMGKGVLGRVAYSLRDHAIVFRALKDDMNTQWGTENPMKLTDYNIRRVNLADVLTIAQYVEYIDPSYVELLVANNVTDAYHLAPLDVVHLGYQIADIHGPTIETITGDSCDLYPSDKYPATILTNDIKVLPKCRCREYYMYGWCPGDPKYFPGGYSLQSIAENGGNSFFSQYGENVRL